jgi:hypothetical protein
MEREIEDPYWERKRVWVGVRKALLFLGDV